MEFSGSDLSATALVAAIAIVSGWLLSRLRQPAACGYVLVGIVLGPSGFAIIDQTAEAARLAELAVVLVVFLVGMELNLRAFRAVLPTAMLCTLLQIASTVGLAVVMAQLIGQPLPTGVLFGCIVALSSTTVAVDLLNTLGLRRRRVGWIGAGLLIAQGLAMAPMLIIIDAVGNLGFDRISLLKLLLTTGALAAFVWALGRRRRRAHPVRTSLEGRDDMVPLAALGCCFAAAALSSVLGLTAALGAFLAGLAIGNATPRGVSMRTTRPIQSVAHVAFFLPLGLMVDLSFLWENLPVVLGWLALVIALKTVAHVGVLHFLGVSWQRAFPAGLVLAPGGEFSFALAIVGRESGLLTADAGRMAIAVIGLSLLASPLLQRRARRFLDVAIAGRTELGTTLADAYAADLRHLGCATSGLRRAFRTLAGALTGPRRRRSDSADLAPDVRPR